MMLTRTLLVLLFSLTLLTACAEARELLPPLQDLQADASQSRRSGLPIVLFFYSHTCPYCRVVEQDYLQWVVKDNERQPRILLRAVDINADTPITNFDGSRTGMRALARAQGVRLVPHLRFVGPAGEGLAPDLIGVSIPDYYAGYLEEAIQQAVEQLRAKPGR